MEHAGPSRTALATAYARAYHQLSDRPTIFTDDLAARLLGITSDDLAALSKRPDDPVGAVISDRARRLFFAARARLAEDTVAAAVGTGTRQIVILGAGLDTFAYRNHNPTLQIFEVDHPATQAWKRECLASAGIDLPPALTLVPVDFETHDLAAELEAAAFARTEPAIFVWLGVVFYLTPSAAHTTLDYIAGQAQPVEVVFDYLQPATTDDDRAHLRARADRLASAGEPFISYFTPDEVARLLHTLGFTDIEDRNAQDVINAYLGETPDYATEAAHALRASRILRARR